MCILYIYIFFSSVTSQNEHKCTQEYSQMYLGDVYVNNCISQFRQKYLSFYINVRRVQKNKVHRCTQQGISLYFQPVASSSLVNMLNHYQSNYTVYIVFISPIYALQVVITCCDLLSGFMTFVLSRFSTTEMNLSARSKMSKWGRC